MNMNNKEYNTFKKLISIVSEHTDVLTQEELAVYTDSIVAISYLDKRREVANAKSLNRITEKRKENKNYGRSVLPNGKYW